MPWLWMGWRGVRLGPPVTTWRWALSLDNHPSKRWWPLLLSFGIQLIRCEAVVPKVPTANQIKSSGRALRFVRCERVPDNNIYHRVEFSKYKSIRDAGASAAVDISTREDRGTAKRIRIHMALQRYSNSMQGGNGEVILVTR